MLQWCAHVRNNSSRCAHVRNNSTYKNAPAAPRRVLYFAEHSLVVGLEQGLVCLLELESRQLVAALFEARDDRPHEPSFASNRRGPAE